MAHNQKGLPNIEKEEIMDLYKEALNGNSADKDLWFEIGVKLENIAEFRHALHAFEKVIEIDYNNVEAWYCKYLLLDLLLCRGKAISAYNILKDLPRNIDHSKVKRLKIANESNKRISDQKKVHIKNVASRTLTICLLFSVICMLSSAGYLPGLDVIDNVYESNTLSMTPYGKHIDITNYINSTDPTWDELILFIQEDETDQICFDDDSFVCADYAEMLHDNAEKEGIKAAYVSIQFKDKDTGHAINAFRTTDRGLVFIDCTGAYEEDKEILMKNGHINLDKVAYLKEGENLGLIPLKEVTAAISQQNPIANMVKSTPQLEYQFYEEYSAEHDHESNRIVESYRVYW
ncbi:hypothetical protein [Methanococcoides methylutens]|uniref:Uncharacterized protein n=1 Tax=Methanococcoides methylutens MM1 TaxID=1434104 RepID=A0A0E3ST29_METMT|nr:hypothetical protein [Methanococcoides methylutens]AKB85878.1 hypothetical protein MCMEM_1825 [Methanococcoides methylutens MM1]